MRVVLLLQDPRAILRVESAFSLPEKGIAGPPLHALRSWEELEALASRGEFGVAFVQPDFGAQGGQIQAQELVRLRSLSGPESIILYSCGTEDLGSHLTALGRLKFPFVLVRDVDDDPRSILRVAARAACRRELTRRVEQVAALVDPEASELLALLVMGWPPATSVAEVAKRFHIAERTLFRRLQALGLPPPGRLARWGQLLEACALLRMGVRRPAQVAELVGRGSPSSLDRLCRDLTKKGFDRLTRAQRPEPLWERFLSELVV